MTAAVLPSAADTTAPLNGQHTQTSTDVAPLAQVEPLVQVSKLVNGRWYTVPVAPSAALPAATVDRPSSGGGAALQQPTPTTDHDHAGAAALINVPPAGANTNTSAMESSQDGGGTRERHSGSDGISGGISGGSSSGSNSGISGSGSASSDVAPPAQVANLVNGHYYMAPVVPPPAMVLPYTPLAGPPLDDAPLQPTTTTAAPADTAAHLSTQSDDDATTAPDAPLAQVTKLVNGRWYTEPAVPPAAAAVTLSTTVAEPPRGETSLQTTPINGAPASTATPGNVPTANGGTNTSAMESAEDASGAPPVPPTPRRETHSGMPPPQQQQQRQQPLQQPQQQQQQQQQQQPPQQQQQPLQQPQQQQQQHGLDWRYIPRCRAPPTPQTSSRDSYGQL